MKKFLLIILIGIGCGQQKERSSNTEAADTIDTLAKTDNTVVEKKADTTNSGIQSLPQFNDRFKDVILTRLSADSARLTGKARIFEATLSYAIYDKGKKVYEGFHTTSAGAPEWGDFDFNIAIPGSAGHSGTYVLLFESSAKDGSPQGVLKFPL